MIRLYNVLRKFCYLSNTKKTELVEVPNDEVLDTETEENAGLTKALDTYRKLFEKKGADPLTEKEQENFQKRIDAIEEREVVEKIIEHDPVEIPCEKNKITIGPPTLTRFEKARIMGQEHCNCL